MKLEIIKVGRTLQAESMENDLKIVASQRFEIDELSRKRYREVSFALFFKDELIAVDKKFMSRKYNPHELKPKLKVMRTEYYLLIKNLRGLNE